MKKYILAGSWKQVKDYGKKNNIPYNDLVYVYEVESLRGSCAKELIRIGNWYDRKAKDISKILEYACVIGCKVIDDNY